MIIGVPKETKTNEHRVGMVPSSVNELTLRGHSVIVETGAGVGIGIEDEQYIEVGAQIVATAKDVFDKADLVIKVKEPQPEECRMLRPNQILFTFLHLAPDPVQADLLLQSGATAIAYETVTDDGGRLPLLAPMSEVAGRMAVQAGVHCLEKQQGGKGILLGGVPGVSPAKVVILGGGVVGSNALKIALGMGANITVIDRSLVRLRELDDQYYGTGLHTEFATQNAVAKYLLDADLVVGAILVPGGTAPKIVSRDMLKGMHPGSVIVDVAIDQGGCIETARPTSHEQPTFVEEGVLHYCVTNMPSAVPKTAALALNHATLPFIIAIAEKGVKRACSENVHLQNGLNVFNGKVTHEAVAVALGKEYASPEKTL